MLKHQATNQKANCSLLLCQDAQAMCEFPVPGLTTTGINWFPPCGSPTSAHTHQERQEPLPLPKPQAQPKNTAG